VVRETLVQTTLLINILLRHLTSSTSNMQALPALLFVAELLGKENPHDGDLATSLTPAVEGDYATYTIGFSPSSAADGKSHRMQVKLKDKRGFKVRHSAGYFYANEPDSLKERVRQLLAAGRFN